jgi:hypothetical protein
MTQKTVAQRSFTIPDQGLEQLGELAVLGPSKLQKLSNLLSRRQTSLDFHGVIRELAESLDIEVQRMLPIAGLLMGLNQLRVEKEMSPASLVQALEDAINRQAPTWEFKDQWRIAIPFLPAIFEPNNLLSIAGKTQELWTNRPAKIQELRIFTDLRPVFDEEATSAIALVLTNTLIVEYFDEVTKHKKSLHLSLNQDDLVKLRQQLERTQKKNAAASSDCERWKIDLLTIGGD